MLRKLSLYKKALELRKQGYSYSEISKFISVSHSTMSRWCRNVCLTNQQRERLLDKRKRNPFICSIIETARQNEIKAKEWAVDKTKQICVDKNLLFIIGMMLYWAEGSKFKKYRAIEFTNTDSNMIQIIMSVFRNILNVAEDRFRLTVRISNKGNFKKAEKFWLKITGLSKMNLRRPELLELKSSSQSLNKYPYGMCRVSINNSFLFRKIDACTNEIIKKLLDYCK